MPKGPRVCQLVGVKIERELAVFFEEKVSVGETERVSSLYVNRKMKRVVMSRLCEVEDHAVIGPRILCYSHPM